VNEITFEAFPKIPRLKRSCVITEKIDGTNAQVIIAEDGVTIAAGSRNRLITPEDDNYGFARWVQEHRDELLLLGPGRHFGEWWGSGIQRGYGLTGGEKRFSLFNVGRWSAPLSRPACCCVVPTLYHGAFTVTVVDEIVEVLRKLGSCAAPGFMNPEGVITFLPAANSSFKTTLKDDESPKTLA